MRASDSIKARNEQARVPMCAAALADSSSTLSGCCTGHPPTNHESSFPHVPIKRSACRNSLGPPLAKFRNLSHVFCQANDKTRRRRPM